MSDCVAPNTPTDWFSLFAGTGGALTIPPGMLLHSSALSRGAAAPTA